MVTVRFEIKPYLAAYMYARYGTPPIRLSALEPLYHTLHFFTVPHPANLPYQRETGNILFVLPAPRDGKNPEKYNYLGNENIRKIEQKIELQMKMELYDYMLENRFKRHITYKLALEEFVDKYEMTELIPEETLMRGFQRWRKKRKSSKQLMN